MARDLTALVAVIPQFLTSKLMLERRKEVTSMSVHVC